MDNYFVSSCKRVKDWICRQFGQKEKKAVKSTDAKNCVGYEERTPGGGGHAVAFGMRHGFPYLPFFKAGRNAGVVPDLPGQCVGDGGHPTGNLEAE